MLGIIRTTLIICRNVLSTDVRLIVHESPSYRPQIFIFPSFNAQWPIVHRPVTDRSPPSDWSFNAQWLIVHRPVNDGEVFKEKREDLVFSLIMTRFVTLRSQLTQYPVRNGYFIYTERRICVLRRYTVSSHRKGYVKGFLLNTWGEEINMCRY